VDVVFDHFLATDPLIFPDEEKLQYLATGTYQVLQQYFDVLPPRFQLMVPYMQQQNWLYNYRSHEGIRQSLGGVVRRSAYLTESAIAFRIFEEQYLSLKECYTHFFPELLTAARAFIAE
jgi:acyl carrier protein phosphodiesterase